MADSTTSASLTVDAPPAQVLDVIADLAAYPQWNTEITGVEVERTLPGGRPGRARFRIASGGMTDEYVLDYTWADDRVGWQLVAPSQLQKAQVGSYTLVPEGPGTQVRYELRLESRIPMIGAMRRTLEKRIVAGALQQLKRRVEEVGP